MSNRGTAWPVRMRNSATHTGPHPQLIPDLHSNRHDCAFQKPCIPALIHGTMLIVGVDRITDTQRQLSAKP